MSEKPYRLTVYARVAGKGPMSVAEFGFVATDDGDATAKAMQRLPNPDSAGFKFARLTDVGEVRLVTTFDGSS